jgi:hypothetical protein
MNYKITFPENYVKPKLPFRDKWCAALRSGEFKQGAQFLKKRNEDSYCYCCLGVLCETENVPDLINESIIPDDADYVLCFIGAIGTFPDGVKLEAENGYSFIHLSTTNDRSGLSFSQIADVIEQIWDQK